MYIAPFLHAQDQDEWSARANAQIIDLLDADQFNVFIDQPISEERVVVVVKREGSSAVFKTRFALQGVQNGRLLIVASEKTKESADRVIARICIENVYRYTTIVSDDTDFETVSALLGPMQKSCFLHPTIKADGSVFRYSDFVVLDRMREERRSRKRKQGSKREGVVRKKRRVE